MAHKKAGGSSRNGRDSAGKRLGIKAFGGEHVVPGNIIARQRGTKWHPGTNVGMGTDHTLFAKVEGHVEFRTKAEAHRPFVGLEPQQLGGQDQMAGRGDRQIFGEPLDHAEDDDKPQDRHVSWSRSG